MLLSKSRNRSFPSYIADLYGLTQNTRISRRIAQDSNKVSPMQEWDMKRELRTGELTLSTAFEKRTVDVNSTGAFIRDERQPRNLLSERVHC